MTCPTELTRLLILAATHDIQDSLMWNSSLKFAINCSDAFAWACADSEDIANDSDINDLAKAILDAGDVDGPLLYCARRRSMRPQGAMYDHIDNKHWHLFDACGPVREAGFGNPKAQP